MFLKEYTPQYDLDENLSRVKEEYSLEVDDDHLAFSLLALCVHGTTLGALEKILNCGEIRSFETLTRLDPKSVANTYYNATDELDINLGLHKYVFLGVGRVHPGDLQDVYICFPNTVLEQKGNLVAIQEIAHHGAIVSPEAAQVYRIGRENLDVSTRNANAADSFFKEVVHGEDFHHIYAPFLQQDFENLLGYITQPYIPSKPPQYCGLTSDNRRVTVCWEGPQLMVPHKLNIDDAFFFVMNGGGKAAQRIVEKGIDENRVFCVNEVLPEYYSYLQDMVGSPQSYMIANLALRDLALIGRHNRFRVSRKDLMIGFKDRA